MQNGELRIGMIGSGARIQGVYRDVYAAGGPGTRIVRAFDPEPAAVERLRGQPGAAQVLSLRSWQQVIDDPEVNVVMIGSPNAFHADPAIAAMEAGKTLFLEKPLAASLEDHHRLMAAQRRTGARVALGFVLRYTPFYRAVKELIDSGRLGRIMFLQAVEHMGLLLTADVYLRGWRAYRDVAGPLLLEKCCHDLDIINWLVGTQCESVTALSDRTVFVPNAARPLRCRDCDDADCAYRAEGTISERISQAIGHATHISGEDDACVYNRGQDIDDHTTLLARYGGGVHVSFNVTMGAARGARRIRIIGSRGELSGCAEDNSIVFQALHADSKPEFIKPEIRNPGSHYGGDFVLADDFVRLCRDPQVTSSAGIAEGYESGLICLAADASARSGSPVEMSQFRSTHGRTIGS